MAKKKTPTSETKPPIDETIERNLDLIPAPDDQPREFMAIPLGTPAPNNDAIVVDYSDIRIGQYADFLPASSDVEKVEVVPEGQHIVELLVENIMKVRVAHIKPKGNVVQITGKNGQGKTSVLRAIAWALTGTSDVPSQPIRQGQRVGTIKMDLGDLVVTRYFTRVEGSEKGNTYLTRLTVEGKSREQFRSPQGLLDALMGKISFDPLAFTRMKDDKQVETLRGLVKFDIDIDALDAEQKADYDARRQAGRDMDSTKARLAGMMVPRPDLPAEPIDVEAITRRLEGAANHNSIVAAKRAEKKRYEEQADEVYRKAAVLREEAFALLEKATNLDGLGHSFEPIETVPEPNERQRLMALSASITVAEEIDTAALAAELTQANAINRELAHAQAYEAVVKELEEATEKWETLDKAMKDREQRRNDAIKRAPMPLEGLGIGNGEVLYKGLPLGQASNAEQICVSMALAMTSNPKLRVLRIADGSLLDSESMELVASEAEKHGFQVWIERVDSTGSVGVVMEDGQAFGEEVVEK